MAVIDMETVVDSGVGADLRVRPPHPAPRRRVSVLRMDIATVGVTSGRWRAGVGTCPYGTAPPRNPWKYEDTIHRMVRTMVSMVSPHFSRQQPWASRRDDGGQVWEPAPTAEGTGEACHHPYGTALPRNPERGTRQPRNTGTPSGVVCGGLPMVSPHFYPEPANPLTR